jgi:hypothetical protein
MGHQGRSGRVRKISPPPPGFDPRTVQSVPSLYTVCVIPAHDDDDNDDYIIIIIIIILK